MYKYDETQATDGTGLWAQGDFEFDTYVLSMPVAGEYDIASACPPLPLIVPAGAAASVQLFLAEKTPHSLLVDVRGAGGTILAGAEVRLRRGAYDETIPTDACGQAFFSGIAPSTDGSAYALSVTAAGYQPFSASDLGVSGATAQPVLLDPL